MTTIPNACKEDNNYQEYRSQAGDNYHNSDLLWFCEWKENTYEIAT